MRNRGTVCVALRNLFQGTEEEKPSPWRSGISMKVENTVKDVKEVNNVNLELVWDPPWDKSMITEAGKLELNI